MTHLRPHPELWQPIAQLLLALRAFLREVAPHAFATASVRVTQELRLCGAMVRRYLFALAREIVLPPLKPLAAPASPRAAHAASRRHTKAFDPGERARASRSARAPAEPAPEIDWALALQRAEALLAALRHPLPLARRLAFRLARNTAPPLRELPVPAHILRAIHPAYDALLMRLDALARPDAWAGMHPDTG